jgi:2-oxoglutarate dehydrogenase E1 component
LINFSPKANLRHHGSYSRVEEFTTGGFCEVIDDKYVDASKVKKVLLCSGKMYFDLQERQQKDNQK